MAQRKLQEVDASSIADVAFILLAFIIIITTLQKEEGIPAVLPQKRDDTVKEPPIIKKRNIRSTSLRHHDHIINLSEVYRYSTGFDLEQHFRRLFIVE